MRILFWLYDYASSRSGGCRPRSIVLTSKSLCFALVLASIAHLLRSEFRPHRLSKDSPTATVRNRNSTRNSTRYLIVDVRGGLTNQQVMIEEAMVLASISQRQLVVPRVRTHIPHGQIYAGSRVPSSDMEELWDVASFKACAANMGITVADASSIDPGDLAASSFYYGQNWGGLDEDKVYQELEKSWYHFQSAAQPLLEDDAAVVTVVAPFRLLKLTSTSRWVVGAPGRILAQVPSCFVPSSSIQARMEKLMPTSPYTCLHARVELDWFQHCCKNKLSSLRQPQQSNAKPVALLDPNDPSSWTCTEPVDSSPPVVPTRKCYSSPSRIARILKCNGIAHQATVWVASGASNQALEPLYDEFDVRRIPKLDKAANSSTGSNINGPQYFMDYKTALIDREICSKATHAWGQRGSSFLWRMNIPIKHYSVWWHRCWF